MTAKKLPKLKVTDLRKQYNSLGDFWEVQEEAVKEFRRRFIEGALETEWNMHLGYNELFQSRPEYQKNRLRGTESP